MGSKNNEDKKTVAQAQPAPLRPDELADPQKNLRRWEKKYGRSDWPFCLG